MITAALAPILAIMSSPWEWGIVLVVALLLFGKRLPEVMRSMGRGIVEFKKGIRGVEDEIDAEVSRPVDTAPKSVETDPAKN
ncbi:MAG: twin-arginine translocase TatA/TatE family subunit [Planctomycetota bacterium]